MISRIKINKDGNALAISYVQANGQKIKVVMFDKELLQYNGFLNIVDMQIHFKNGILHREDGPAVFHEDEQLWYLNGKKYSFKKYWDMQLKTKEGKRVFAAHFGNK